MGAGELAAAAVGVVAAAITGAATRVGEQAGAAITQVVRDRLGASDRGRAALTGLDESGASPEAQAGATAILAEEIEADPRLRHALALHLAPHVAGGVTIDRNRMRGDNPILVGSGTINFRKPTSAAGMVALVLAVLVVLAVIVLAVYGGSRVLGSDDSSDSGHGSASATAGENDGPTSSSGSEKKTITPRALTVAEAKEVVPGLEDMPSGWTVFSERNGFRLKEAEATGCNRGTAIYENPKMNSGNLQVSYAVTACRDIQKVIGWFAGELKSANGPRDAQSEKSEETRITMPRCGDESFATTFDYPNAPSFERGENIEIRARVGAVFVDMTYGPIGDDLHSLDAMERAQALMQLVCDRAVAFQSTL
ncbi:hypothetical protein JK361_37230 [Streptomyces sp. 5-8]|uniref:PknH-like extracellular domain-containing protein n=1 Tax=Streptomyces musisoli TaxID=2802280 RepID=A0ABS1PCP2_9ACTN|nr:MULTISPECIES: hypothetical protein [Streptomyces]MBL1110143.1 hypothetical protein [Streptomyces musisoli]MBY8845989.1 hypothetical protein [Streptomyces sp. SP2-10]